MRIQRSIYNRWKARRLHVKPFRPITPPIEVRVARQGTVHPREWVCGLNCGLLFRYAHAGEIPRERCHAKGAHEFIVCPAHLALPICTIHSPSFAGSA